VGLVTFDRRVRRLIPARAGLGHLRVLLDALQEEKPGGETELARIFHDLVPQLKRRGLLIIISDCFGDLTELVAALAHFRFARHEAIILQVLDRDELEFPFQNWTRFDSLETADRHQLVDTSQFRSVYLDNLKRFQTGLKQGCHRHHIDLAPLVTDQAYAEGLAQYLSFRLARS
jgi:uncharacterized protein (DUF58 family)